MLLEFLSTTLNQAHLLIFWHHVRNENLATYLLIFEEELIINIFMKWLIPDPALIKIYEFSYRKIHGTFEIIDPELSMANMDDTEAIGVTTIDPSQYMQCFREFRVFGSLKHVLRSLQRSEGGSNNRMSHRQYTVSQPWCSQRCWSLYVWWSSPTLWYMPQI